LTTKFDGSGNGFEAFDSRRELMEEQLLTGARRVAVPILLVRGALSDVVSPEGVAAFLEAVPHADYVDVNEAGHMVSGDQNDAFTAAVIDFLTRTSRNSS
jgi:pimeloyl-ACP methyl ester carboxylesterase